MAVREEIVRRAPGPSVFSASPTTGAGVDAESGDQEEDDVESAGRAPRAVWTWCKSHRRLPLTEQQQHLARKIRGHCAYHGLTGSGRALCAFRHWTYIIWRWWLNRRSHHTRGGLAGLDRRLERYPLPNATVVHSV